MKSVLLVDDDLEFTDIACRIIEYLECEVFSAATLKEAKQWLDTQHFDHVLLDFMLPDGSGLHLLDHINVNGISTQVTMITGHPSVKNAIAQICSTEIGHLTKPIDADDLKQVLCNAGGNNLPNKNKTQSHALYFDCLIGESSTMKDMYRMIERVAQTDANIMLLGESGVGKEMVAQAIHNASKLSGQRVSVNCGAIPKDLIGSELFGHEKGAFTGANAQKKGVFELAQDGTLFLDELTEMPIEMQPNLLRVLETQTVTRVGGTKSIDVNCRVISATNRSVEEIAQNKVLREDIYFRLAVFPISIPPLRERKEDIALLAQYFLDDMNKQNKSSLALTDLDMALLMAHDWPGNIRELKHTIHRAFIMADLQENKLVFPASFDSPFSRATQAPANANPPPQILSPHAPVTPPPVNTRLSADTAVGTTIEELEKELIYKTLASVDGNKTNAAKILGISTKTLYNRLNSYEQTH
ncbi:Regulatory protein AtoC [Pseudoalteromonas holothuriae]|uniref:Regulatory protein AtoC n=1 Tax=Pseudoalteromonas holothuriae TaxID=2963714 RepID=A0ABM9GKL6_9GAMM|nr:sigma-54 dependent transcriptional regulator [Pseudoalteromonas sp. CIP111951]CAH9063573.1 Regulatory protein AtoC [Pseudoalteromonas sp. CIP111951]